MVPRSFWKENGCLIAALSGILLFVLGNCAITYGISREGRRLFIERNSNEFGSLYEALNSGVIKVGADFPSNNDSYCLIDDHDYGRPVGFMRIVSENGSRYVVFHFNRDDEFITLYGSDGSLVGASYSRGKFMGKSHFDLKWFFMDEVQMALCVEAMNAE